LQIYQTRWFVKYAKRERISDRSLIEAIDRAERGLVDADLGGGLIKQRVARTGEGRSGGYRMLIAYRIGHRAIFVFGFAKSTRGNVDPDQLTTARSLGAAWLAADDDRIEIGVAEGELKEIFDRDQET
jgi:hypothetical protein